MPGLSDWLPLIDQLDRTPIPDLDQIALMVVAARTRRVAQSEAAKQAVFRVVSDGAARGAASYGLAEALRYLDELEP